MTELYVSTPSKSGTGSITTVESTDASVAVTGGSGPTVNLSALTSAMSTFINGILTALGVVTTVFGRAGAAITAQKGDYNATQVPNVVVNVTWGATAQPAIDTDNGTYFSLTGGTTPITSLSANLSGTPVHGQEITIEYTSAGAQTIARGASFAAPGSTFPAGTQAGVILREHYTYNTVTNTWDLLWATYSAAGSGLTNGGATLAAQLNFAASATTTMFTTPSLAPGTYLFTFTGKVQTSAAGASDVQLVAGTATASFVGPTCNETQTNNQGGITIALTTLVTVTVAGTLIYQVVTNTNGNGFAPVDGLAATAAPINGYTYAKIA